MEVGQAMEVDLSPLVAELAVALASPIAEAVAAHQGIRRQALSIQEACESLGVSWDFWHEQIEPEVRLVRRGRRKMVPTAELDRWLDANAAALFDGTGSATPTAQKSPANGGVRASRGPVRGTR
jgi:hypothetical protein